MLSNFTDFSLSNGITVTICLNLSNFQRFHFQWQRVYSIFSHCTIFGILQIFNIRSLLFLWSECEIERFFYFSHFNTIQISRLEDFSFAYFNDFDILNVQMNGFLLFLLFQQSLDDPNIKSIIFCVSFRLILTTFRLFAFVDIFLI